MRNIISNHIDKCVGCNRCVRVCPIDEANVAWLLDDGEVRVKVDNTKCIACGNCLKVCHHGSRRYDDDTERFFKDLRAGTPISMFAAPAVKSNFKESGALFTWLRSSGVKHIYDVSLGADICTWAHIRYIQKNGPKPIISQPCPAIVNYVLLHRNELIKYLSPVHSPMLCTAIYMRKYEKVGTKIAALSPCIAKSHEFDATNVVDYNITFEKLQQYMDENHVKLPVQQSGFDNFHNAALGSLYPMPGGLKESVEHYVGKSLRIDKSEGLPVYKALDEYIEHAKRRDATLPVLFDVLNCADGCNVGTGCIRDKDIFEIHAKMDFLRQEALHEDNVQHTHDLFQTFDDTLQLDDFIRRYVPQTVRPIPVTQDKINEAFVSLGKLDDASKEFSCGACGCDTCYEMAVKVAKGVNIPQNCAEKAHEDVQKEHSEIKDLSKSNLNSFQSVLGETAHIKEMVEGMSSSVSDITQAILSYDRMIDDIEKISMKVNIISLNASVEAAKAGQHGRAFDVVAKEIRSLAQDSANSAAQTKKVSEKANVAAKNINDSMAKINKNVKTSYDSIAAASESTKKLLNE